MPKKLEGGPFGIFQHSLSPNIHCHKNRRGPFGDFFFEKKSTKPKKKQRWDPLVSAGIVCYTEKKENFFWFSSLGKHLQLCSTLKFCRTFGRTILVT